MSYNEALFLENAAGLGLTVTADALNRFAVFSDLLCEKNKVMNLTAITDANGVSLGHFADSISLLAAADIPDGSRVIDVGTGAGFPGVPLLIMNPSLRLTLLDSTRKKLDFISESLASLNLSAELLHSRAEERGRDKAYRESFDFAVSRAVAGLNVLCEYCLPFVKTGGCFLAMKGPGAQDEIKEAYTALKTLGGEVENSVPVSLTDGHIRNIAVIRKIKETPDKYPRASAQIAKKPL